jgi:hypothetical protein
VIGDLQLDAPHRHADMQVHGSLVAHRGRNSRRGELTLGELGFSDVQKRRDGDQIVGHDR